MITTENLTKVYKSKHCALNNISFSVKEGEIFGFLGPNGAGKSSTIKILTTLSLPTSGKAIIAGNNIVDYPLAVRKIIGYVGQEVGVDYFITGRENLVLQGRFYRLSTPEIKTRVEELLSLFDLTKEADQLVSTYSGGMRRKLDIATALIHKPKILFLDEPTLGLDPQSRITLWDYIRRLNEELRLTIFLTTHYLDEADKLANRICIIHKGNIKVTDTPANLKKVIKGDSVSLDLEKNNGQQYYPEEILKGQNFVNDVCKENEKLRIYINNGEEDIPKILNILNTKGVKVNSISLSRPSLDDVFLKYTGVTIKEEENNSGGSGKWWEKWQKGGDWSKNSEWQNKNWEEKDLPEKDLPPSPVLAEVKASNPEGSNSQQWPNTQWDNKEAGSSGDWDKNNQEWDRKNWNDWKKK